MEQADTQTKPDEHIRGEPSTKDKAKEHAKETVERTTEQAKEEVERSSREARGKFKEQISAGSTDAGGQITATAQGLRSLSNDLRDQGQGTPAGWIDRAAEKAEQLGGYLEDADADRLLSDIEDFARRNPWAVAIGGLATGFAAARFLKASSSSTPHGRTSQSGQTTS